MRYLSVLRNGINEWLDAHGVESVTDIVGVID